MVLKKDAVSWQPCSGYYALHSVTRFDSYPISRIKDVTASLHDTTVFSNVDLVRAYHQIPATTEDVEKTPVSTPFDLFKFLRRPFWVA